MPSESNTTFVVRRFIALALVLVCAAAVRAQQTAPAQPTPPSPVDTARTEIKQQIEALDENITQAEASATDERAAQLGIPIQDLRDKSLRLREIRSVLEDHLDALDAYQESQRAISGVENDIKNYPGLSETSFTPWVVDTYRDAVDARMGQCEIEKRGLAQAKQQFVDQQKALKDSEGALSVATEKLSVNSDPAQKSALEWQVDVAARTRLLQQARLSFTEFGVQLAQARADLCDKQLDLDERKQKDAESKEQYRSPDLQAKRDEMAKQREDLTKQRSAAEVQRDKDKKKLEEARAALEKSVEDEEFAVNQIAVDQRKVEAEASQDRATLLREQLDYLYHTEEIWSARYALHMTPKEVSLRAQRTRLSDYLAALGVSRRSLEMREDVLRADVRELSQRLAQMEQSVNTLDNTQQKLKLRTAQLDIFGQSLLMLDQTEKLSKRVLGEIAAAEKRQSIGERFQQISETAQQIWDKELFNLDGRPLTVRKIGLALIILALGLALTRLITRFLRRALHARPHIDPNAAATVERLVHYGLLVFIVLFALQTVNIPLTVFTFFGGALAIGVGFGAQNLINNFISGLILMAERPIKIGDIVEIDGRRGRIAEIGARCSRLALFSGVDILVPNSSFLEKSVINWTLSDPKVRFSVTVGVDYGTDTRSVAKLIMKALEDHGKILKNPAPSVLFTDFGDNSLLFEAQFWLNLAEVPDSGTVSSDLRHMIDRAFRDAGISIAYPQRDVHLDSIKPIEVKIVSDARKNDEESGEGTSRQ